MYLQKRLTETIPILIGKENQEQYVLALASSILDNIIISRKEQENSEIELVCLMRELVCLLSAMESPDELTLKKARASIERAERYTNHFIQNLYET